MKTRIVKTTYWEDDNILSLNPETRGFYLYLFTNAKINIIGVYELPEMIIMLQTGYSKEKIREMKEELQVAGRAGFVGAWVIIPNAIKHSNYLASDSNVNAAKKEWEIIPDNIKVFLQNNYTTLYSTVTLLFTVVSTVPINNKSERKGGVGGKQGYPKRQYSPQYSSDENYPFSTLWDVTDYNLASPDHKEKISNAIRGRFYLEHEGWKPPINTPPELLKLFKDQIKHDETN